MFKRSLLSVPSPPGLRCFHASSWKGIFAVFDDEDGHFTAHTEVAAGWRRNHGRSLQVKMGKECDCCPLSNLYLQRHFIHTWLLITFTVVILMLYMCREKNRCYVLCWSWYKSLDRGQLHMPELYLYREVKLLDLKHVWNYVVNETMF